MSSIIFNDKITENNYGELIEQFINIFRLSNVNKYILLALKIEKSECAIRLSILNNDGNNEVYEPIKMDSNSNFFHDFLRDLITAIRENCPVTKEDTVNLDDDNFVAFRMITEFNDMVTIDGLSENEVESIRGKKEESKGDSLIESNKGGSSLTGLLFMITFLIISFICVVAIVD